VLGRNKAGTLRLHEDDHGLAIEIDPPDTQWARDLMVSMERGDVTQMSFGFTVAEDSWEQDKDEKVTRTILKIKELYDVSPVTFPAYPQTEAHVRDRFNAFVKTRNEAVDSSENDEELSQEAGALWEMENKRRRLDLLEKI
jgi:hypothetical protein